MPTGDEVTVPFLVAQPGICHTQSVSDANCFSWAPVFPWAVSFPLSNVDFFILHCILNAVILTEIKCEEKINDLVSSCCCQKKCKIVFDLVALKK